jgi:rubrerythrin
VGQDDPDVLGLMIEHETAIGQLYEAFATVFAERQNLWQTLSREERGHAGRLGKLRSEPTVDDWLSHHTGLRPQAIRSSIGYIDSQRLRAQEGRLNLVQALSVAEDLEAALIENQFARVSDSVSTGIRTVLTDIAAETERHRQMLIEALAEEKLSSS